MNSIGMLATYPARKESLLEMLPTVLPQLDRLYIYCNEYSQDDLIGLHRWVVEKGVSDKVSVIDPEYTEGNVKDMGKFWALSVVAGYVFLLDDDLRYPPDYTQRHIQAIERHRGISAVHGRVVLNSPMKNYFKDTKSFHYRQALEREQIVDIPGTGTTAFKSTYFSQLHADRNTMLKWQGMADVWFACQAFLQGAQIVCIERPANWLSDTAAARGTGSLYEVTKKDCTDHCKMLNQIGVGG